MLRYLLVVLAGLVLTGCGTTLDVAGVSYRTKGAYKAELGIAGMKRTSWLNMFDPKEMPNYGGVLLAQTRTEIYDERARKTALSAAAKQGESQLEANLKTDSSNKEKGRYVVIEIMNPLQAARQLNDPTNAVLRDYLSVSKNSRVVTSVAIAYEYEKISQFNLDSSGRLPVKQIGADLSLTLTTANNQTLRVSDGTVFAYEFSRIIWRKKGTQLEVFDIVPDRTKADREIPDGMSDDPTKFK